MSAEIPGARPEFRPGTNKVTDLVEKIMIVTGHSPDVAAVYGHKIGSYAGEITLAALDRGGLLSPDFTIERFIQEVAKIDTDMNLGERAEETHSRGEST